MKVKFDATDELVVITGGALGIGAELARATATAGANTVVCDVDDKAGQSLCATHPRLHYRQLDVSSREQVFDVIGSVEQEFGAINGLVLGAAIQPRAPLAELSAAEWSRVLDVNLNGVLWAYQAAVPLMLQHRRGSIIAFTSGLAATGWADSAPYAASKAALIAMAKSAAKEIAKHGVRFNLVSPGVIDTVQYREANAGSDHDFWSSTLGVGKPEDAVGTLMFLLSDAAAITASVVSRDFAFPAIQED